VTCGIIYHQPPCVVVPYQTPPGQKDKDKPGKGGKDGKDGKGGEGGEIGSAEAAPAFLVVNLPAEAKLTIDGNATKLSTSERTFQTPELEPGKVFHYTLVAEMTRDGQPVTTTQKVAVQAGKETRVTLEMPAAANVAAR